MSGESKSMLVAGGCFWCVQSDFKKLPGVISAVSGYAGGTTKNPTYATYAEGGHREVVEVTYDPEKVHYRDIANFALFHMDPTDEGGSFHDRGHGYTPALYFENTEEQEIAEAVIKEIAVSGAYEKALTVAVEPRPTFYPAEGYHQDYDEKNPEHYRQYRTASGRDEFIRIHYAK